MTTEPKYDEDVVNLGYLKKIVADPEGNLENIYENVSKHYASKPQPPYHKGDTWIDGNIIYTCINDREIGTYQDSDWTTESGAKEEAEKKNKVFLRQPSNYSVGDMWILQSDEDHKAGKKGEMLISTAGRKEYDEGDWINMLGYGTIRSINEVANNINDALKRLKIEKEEGIITIFYSNTIPENPILNDLWYVTESIDEYSKEKLYKYNGDNWELIKNNLITVAFEEANQDRLISDGKIQSFYTNISPLDNIGVGDIWNDTTTKKLYRYNGTNWIAVYDTNINEIRKNVETVTETTVQIQTDLGGINQRVNSVETTITTLGQIEKAEGKEITVDASNNPAKLYVYGNTEQETNLSDGLLEQGTITAEGNVDATNRIRTINPIKVIPNTKIVVNANANVSLQYYMYFYDISNNYVANISNWVNVGTETTIPNNNNIKFCRVIIRKSDNSTIIPTDISNFNVGNTPSPDYPSDIRNVGDNINSFDYETAFENLQTSTLNGSTRYYEIKVKPNTAYTLSSNCYIGNKGSIFFTNKNVAPSSANSGITETNKSRTIISDENGIVWVWIRTISNEGQIVPTVNDFENGTYWVKLEQGTKATSYSEYGCGNVGLQIDNKNVLGYKKNGTITYNGLTITYEDGIFTLNGKSEYNGYLNLTDILKVAGNSVEMDNQPKKRLHNGKYTFSYNYISGTKDNTGFHFYIRDTASSSNTINHNLTNLHLTNTQKTFSITELDYVCYIWFSLNVTFTNFKFSFQLEKGETKTDWVQHKQQLVIFPLTEGQLLHKGDYLAEDGIHQVKGTIVYDGVNTKAGGKHTTIINDVRSFYSFSISDKKGISGNAESIKCNMFKTGTGGAQSAFNKGECIWDESTKAFYISINKSRLDADTTAGMNRYLQSLYDAGIPLIVEYKLAEEKIIPYTPEQQKVLDSIETFKGINHIYCIDEIQPERMILTYYPNTPYNDTLVNKDTFDKVTTEMNAEFNIRANEVETSVREQTTASILTLLNNGYLTAEQVNALVNGNAEDIATVKEQLTQTVTSSQMQIEITKAIEGGVSYLKNTLFTIDENGMAIATKQDEFSALYTNRGMELYSYEELIAKFDVNGATVQGNLNLNGELITPNLRMMNADVDGVPHTHIHWIGG